METLGQDVRYGVQMLLKNPGFTAVAVLSLALGIAANSTIFSVISTLLFRTLPFENPHQLVFVWEKVTSQQQQTERRNPRFATFSELRAQGRSFQQMELASLGSDLVTLAGVEEGGQVRVTYIGRNLFQLLGVKPVLGRSFLEEDARNHVSAAVIGHSLWQSRFGGGNEVLGKNVTVDGSIYTVIGVMPPGFWVFPWHNKVDVWLPADPSRNPNSRWLTPVARLKPGVTARQAEVEAGVITSRAEESQTPANSRLETSVEDLHQAFFGGFRTELYFLLGTVGFVLLIACTNVANLLLARGTARQKELAVRSALGAGRLRLVRQFLTESLLLALLGGLVGVFLAVWGIKLFAVLAPGWFPLTDQIRIDVTVLIFTMGVSLLTGVLFGLVPALQASKPNLIESLKEGKGHSAGTVRSRGRNLLLISEVSLALILLVGAGLMMNSFIRIKRVNPGFNPAGLLTAEVFLGGKKYWQDVPVDMKRVTPQGDLFFQQVLDRIERIPGVESAGFITRLPTQGSSERLVTVVGRPAPAPGEQPLVGYNEVSPDVFQTLKIPLRKGRYLTEQDVEGSPWVVVINESMAEKYFPSEAPIGKLLRLSVAASWIGLRDAEEDHPRQIVGVVGDVKQYSLRSKSPAVMYGSHRQHPWEYPGGYYADHLRKSLAIRTALDPTSLIPAVRKAVAQVDKDQPAYDFMTMEQRLADSIALERFMMRLFGVFAGLALILAAVGIYGVMSFFVGQRTHEIGVRMALGALERDVLLSVVKQGLKLTGIGVVIGFLASLGLARLIAGTLYGVTSTDPVTYLVVSLFMAFVAFLASYIPARKAAKIDPMVALRSE